MQVWEYGKAGTICLLITKAEIEKTKAMFSNKRWQRKYEINLQTWHKEWLQSSPAPSLGLAFVYYFKADSPQHSCDEVLEGLPSHWFIRPIIYLKIFVDTANHELCSYCPECPSLFRLCEDNIPHLLCETVMYTNFLYKQLITVNWWLTSSYSYSLKDL